MGGAGKAGVPVLPKGQERYRLCGGKKVCGEAGILCKSSGRGGVRPGAPRQPVKGAAAAGGAFPAGREPAAFVRHFLHGAGN